MVLVVGSFLGKPCEKFHDVIDLAANLNLQVSNHLQ